MVPSVATVPGPLLRGHSGSPRIHISRGVVTLGGRPLPSAATGCKRRTTAPCVWDMHTHGGLAPGHTAEVLLEVACVFS